MQKKYLILVEVSENIFRVFLVVINFVFNIFENTREVFVGSVKEIKQEVGKAKESILDFSEKAISKILSKTFSFIRALFGFNIYKLNTLKIKSNLNNKNNNFLKNRNQDFLIYSNLLAPPQRNFK